MTRSNTCYHSFECGLICMLNGSPCDDGYNGKNCESYINANERPSPDHVFNMQTGKWQLRPNKQPTITQVTEVKDSN